VAVVQLAATTAVPPIIDTIVDGSTMTAATADKITHISMKGVTIF
jgi:hypothetical protein